MTRHYSLRGLRKLTWLEMKIFVREPMGRGGRGAPTAMTRHRPLRGLRKPTWLETKIFVREPMGRSGAAAPRRRP